MSDNNRLDLDSDLEKVSKGFLKDVEEAAKEVKQRKAADQEKDRKAVERKRDRKLSAIIIVAAAVALIFLGYWMFARPVEPAKPIQPPINVANPKVNAPVTTTTQPRAPVRPSHDRGQRGEQHPYGDDMPGQ